MGGDWGGGGATGGVENNVSLQYISAWIVYIVIIPRSCYNWPPTEPQNVHYTVVCDFVPFLGIR